MARPRVLIADALSPRAVEIFAERGVEADVRTGLGADELARVIGAYDGLAVRSATKVTAPILAAAERLKVIGRAGIGVDTIDVPAATQRGIVVMNTPHGNSITTAEHAIALMFALARQIPAADRSTQGGKWEKTRFMGVEVTGKVLGIIGCGNIGSIVADRARGLRMKVLGFDPFLSAERAESLGIERVDLDQLLARADFITIHTPMTPETRGLIDAKALARTKRGVRIVNAARGGLIVEQDLKAALESGHVAGAALDVFEVEPARDNPLFGLDGLVATPHLGASTSEAQENVAVQIAEQISDFLLAGAVANAVNLPSVSAEAAQQLAPYRQLGALLGRLAGQITVGLAAVAIEYEGEIAGLDTRPITAEILAGLLTRALGPVNIVSAPALARERNIQVAETRRDHSPDYQTLIRLTTAGGRRLAVAGTVIAGSKPRLTEIEGVPLEATLGRHMLYLRNRDVPGVIGRVGTTLGAHGINIANFHLGRTAAAADAVLLADIDQPAGDAVIAELRAQAGVLEAWTLSF